MRIRVNETSINKKMKRNYSVNKTCLDKCTSKAQEGERKSETEKNNLLFIMCWAFTMHRKLSEKSRLDFFCSSCSRIFNTKCHPQWTGNKSCKDLSVVRAPHTYLHTVKYILVFFIVKNLKSYFKRTWAGTGLKYHFDRKNEQYFSLKSLHKLV